MQGLKFVREKEENDFGRWRRPIILSPHQDRCSRPLHLPRVVLWFSCSLTYLTSHHLLHSNLHGNVSNYYWERSTVLREESVSRPATALSYIHEMVW
eukprot:scaffold392_cov177-Amphora_coffeaeformis.AAC.3